MDASFGEQFLIAKPTQRYLSILACVPTVLVLAEDRIPPLVQFLSTELIEAFKTSETMLPPWRKASSMLSKWVPGKAHALPVFLGKPSCEQHEEHKRQSSSRPFEDAYFRAVQCHVTKPQPSMEPMRIYGGFGNIVSCTF